MTHPTAPNSPWTPERVATLVECWPDPTISTAEIGRRVGLSKASVIHKSRRMKLPSRESPIGRKSAVPTHTQAGQKLWDEAETAYLREHWGVMPSAEIGVALKRTGYAVIKRAKVLKLRRLAGGVPSTKAKHPPKVVMPVYVARHQHACAWPIGEPGHAGFRFCDEAAVFGRSYCAQHCATAYITVREKVA